MTTAREEQGQKEQTNRNSYKHSEKFIIGSQAAAGIPVSEISQSSGMSREYIYQMKEKVELYAASLDEQPMNMETIAIDTTFKEKTILSLALDCGASEEGIQRYFESVIGINVSIGYISSVLKKSRRKSAGI